ncbi:hypothetical protein [Metabacillus indicus]|uniref:hypothetical protein n=1 Tax=Metabacillus indicus TaxID=246786 RepID=UPI000A788C86|nr:hypothetical protein [Metabacillus indicus]
MTILELLGIFTAVYVIRYFFDSEYKQRKKKWVVSDILITALLAVIVQEVYTFFFI